MKPLLTILLFLTSCTATQQLDFTPAASRPSLTGDYTANFITGNESTVNRYEVQQSPDTISWNTIGIIYPGKSSYSYPIPAVQNWFRIYARGDTDFTTPAIQLMLPANRVSITNTSVTSTSLTWTVSNAVGVSSYLIEKSLDNWKTWSKTTEKPNKGNGVYTYRMAKTTKRYQYRITPIFNDQIKDKPIVFK